MVVQHNITAMNSNRMLGVTTSSQAKSTEKLSSGYKINRAADDAAGLAISEKMRRQIRGLTQAANNAQDGISCVQTAEGALAEVHDMLQRINELAVQSANGTNMSKDREYLNAEVKQLTDEIDKVANSVTFNEQKLLDGKFDTKLQVGSEKGDELGIKIEKMTATALKVDGVDISKADTAKDAIKTVKDALETVSKQRADLGAIQNRLEHKVSNLNNIVENTTAAESRIRDTDMASEMVKFTNNNVLAQAGTAMLAQANQSNQSVLSLLG
jgi:flagellin